MHSIVARLVSFSSIVMLLLIAPATAEAQTRGIISVGGSITLVAPTDDDVASTASIRPLVRLNPRKGWGPAAALNWFRADLHDPAGGDGAFARLQVRPLMLGVGYTVGGEPTLVTFSVVGGPSFNSVEFEDAFRNTQPGNPSIDVDHSLAIRPGVSVTHSLAPRVGLTGFAGYLFNKADVTYRSSAGVESRDRWRADSLVLSVGLVYSLF